MRKPVNPEAAAKRGPKAAWKWSRRKWECVVYELIHGATLAELDALEYCALCHTKNGYVHSSCHCGLDCKVLIKRLERCPQRHELRYAKMMLAKIIRHGKKLGYWTE